MVVTRRLTVDRGFEGSGTCSIVSEIRRGQLIRSSYTSANLRDAQKDAATAKSYLQKRHTRRKRARTGIARLHFLLKDKSYPLTKGHSVDILQSTQSSNHRGFEPAATLRSLKPLQVTKSRKRCQKKHTVTMTTTAAEKPRTGLEPVTFWSLIAQEGQE